MIDFDLIERTPLAGDFGERWRRLETGVPRFPPSNRGESAQEMCIGALDTVGIAFRIGPDFEVSGSTETTMRLGLPDEAKRYRHKLEGGGFLGLGVGGKAWAEASLPKRVDGANVRAVGVPEGLELLRELYAEASLYCEPIFEGERFELSELVRVDAVRDFDGVHHVGELLSGLAKTPRPAVQKVKVFQDPERNRAETLTVGPKAWHMTAYDKHVETAGEAEAGRLRVETRLHKEQLLSQRAKREGWAMSRVGDLSGDVVELCHRSTFELACFDREVVGVASVASAIRSADHLSDERKRELWCYLTMPGAAELMHRNTRTEYRRLAKELGVTPTDAAGEMPDIRVRLDYDKGTEVCRVA